MTIFGFGGVKISRIDYKEIFKSDFKSLDRSIQRKAEDKLKRLLQNPRPRGLGFEKLKGCNNPDIYTIHVTGNFKISFEIIGDCAMLRRIGTHDRIDRTP